ncbi:hypothetical protein Psi02_00070 [Planotetraspora silvatica]|uniref:Uncharacterized protein n=1 Tax=Planotetraspora silvatica TaxID=234614 RepID=A0A8J3UE77_9ACTN|nr:hypothetical protein [Planotetraspora silvatica]GII43583.1 hypothetical protein Psi02_00070 [Planotetraspora silvatica]
MNDHHEDPFREAAAQGLERAVQLTSVAGAAAQVRVQMKAERAREQAEQQQRLARQSRTAHRAARHAARLQWLPANDPAWLKSADLNRVFQAWAATIPYIAEDKAAERTRLKCEERLRELHPYGMRQYDRLRGEGFAPEPAMRKAAPFFSREPNPRTGHAAPRWRELSPVELAQQDFPMPMADVLGAKPAAAPAIQSARPMHRATPKPKA